MVWPLGGNQSTGKLMQTWEGHPNSMQRKINSYALYPGLIYSMSQLSNGDVDIEYKNNTALNTEMMPL